VRGRRTEKKKKLPTVQLNRSRLSKKVDGTERVSIGHSAFLQSMDKGVPPPPFLRSILGSPARGPVGPGRRDTGKRANYVYKALPVAPPGSTVIRCEQGHGKNVPSIYRETGRSFILGVRDMLSDVCWSIRLRQALLQEFHGRDVRKWSFVAFRQQTGTRRKRAGPAPWQAAFMRLSWFVSFSS